MPFTILLTFENNEWLGGVSVVVRKIAPTFDATLGCSHPLKPLPHVLNDTPSCPPSAIADTKFNAGAGLTMVPSGGVASCRVLLEFTDKPKGAERTPDSATLRVTRQCVCGIRAASDATIYPVAQNGPLEETSRLLQIKKGEFAHAIVAWRSADILSLISFHPIEKAQVDEYRKFFKKVEIHTAMFDTAGTHRLELPNMNQGGTPIRVHKLAADASTEAATPCCFESKRKRLE